MPRQTHTVQVPLGSYGDYSVADSADITWLAAHASDKEMFVLTGKEIIIARNVHGANPYTVTITSVANQWGRSENIAAYSLAAGEHAVFGPFKTPGWRQTDGKLYFEAEDVNIEFAVFRLP